MSANRIAARTIHQALTAADREPEQQTDTIERLSELYALSNSSRRWRPSIGPATFRHDGRLLRLRLRLGAGGHESAFSLRQPSRHLRRGYCWLACRGGRYRRRRGSSAGINSPPNRSAKAWAWADSAKQNTTKSRPSRSRRYSRGSPANSLASAWAGACCSRRRAGPRQAARPGTATAGRAGPG